MLQHALPPWRHSNNAARNRSPNRQSIKVRSTSSIASTPAGGGLDTSCEASTDGVTGCIASGLANGAQTSLPSEPLWRSTDFPCLSNSVSAPRSKTPRRRMKRWASVPVRSKSVGTAATSSATDIITYASPAVPHKELDVVHTAHAITDQSSASACSASVSSFLACQELLRVPTPARSISTPAHRHSISLQVAGKHYANTNHASVEVDSLVEVLLSSAQHASASGPDSDHINSFVACHSQAMKLMQEREPHVDCAAVLAMRLICAARLQTADSVEEKMLLPIAEGIPFSHHPEDTLTRSPECPVNIAAFPSAAWHSPHSFLRGTPSISNSACYNSNAATPSLPSLTRPLQFQSRFSSFAPRHFSADSVRYHSSDARPPRTSKYTVINPRTGEKLVISSVVPFLWRHPRRLRILDPKTGEEVLPRGHACNLQTRRSASDEDQQLDVFGCTKRRGASLATSKSNRSLTPVTRRRRRSLVGTAVKEGSAWALNPADGGYWEWPLSRQEKKDRILLLSQLEFVSEIEELQEHANTPRCGASHDARLARCSLSGMD